LIWITLLARSTGIRSGVHARRRQRRHDGAWYSAVGRNVACEKEYRQRARVRIP
jgi:hypothetical protein